MSLKEVIPTSFADLLNLFGISLQGNKDNTLYYEATSARLSWSDRRQRFNLFPRR